MVVCERLESLDDWFGSINWLFLSKITKSSESPMSSKLIEHKSLVHSTLLSTSEQLLLGAFSWFVFNFKLSLWPSLLSLKIFPWTVRFGTGGGAKAKQLGGLLSFTFGVSVSVWGLLSDECRLALLVGDVPLKLLFSFFSLCLSNKPAKQSLGSATLDARSLRTIKVEKNKH